MSISIRDPHIRRGVWCLIVGFFTTWVFGIGVLFLLAAASFAFVSMFGQRPAQGVLLFASTLVFGAISVFIALHIMAVVGIVAFTRIKDSRSPEPAPAKTAPAKHRNP